MVAEGRKLSGFEPHDRVFLNVEENEDQEHGALALALDWLGLAEEGQEPGPAVLGGSEAYADALFWSLNGILVGDQALETRKEDVDLPVR